MSHTQTDIDKQQIFLQLFIIGSRLRKTRAKIPKNTSSNFVLIWINQPTNKPTKKCTYKYVYLYKSYKYFQKKRRILLNIYETQNWSTNATTTDRYMRILVHLTRQKSVRIYLFIIWFNTMTQLHEQICKQASKKPNW